MIKLTQISKQCFGPGDYPCMDTVSCDGRVMIPVSGGCDEPYILLSENGGSSFEKRPFSTKNIDTPFHQLSDGRFMAIGFGSAGFDAIANFDCGPVPYVAPVYRADSFDDVLNGRIATEFSLIDIPNLSAGYGDSGNRHTGCFSGWTQLSNGDLFATMYGQFKDDRILCPYFADNRGYNFYLYRTWCLRSRDLGKTWEFVTTIADCHTYPIADINAEGYCEADVLELEPGHIVCVLRTGGHEVFSPLYCTHSYEFGETWEKPYTICPWGVLPRLLRMRDGTLVIASGHRHTMLLFSRDNGRSWSEPFIVEPCDGLWGDSATGYDCVYEGRPGELTVIYADPKEGIAANARDHRKRRVYAQTLRVEID